MKTDADLLLRIKQERMRRVKNDADMLLKVSGDRKSKKNDAHLLLRVR